MIHFIIIFFSAFLAALTVKDIKDLRSKNLRFKKISLYDMPEKELYNTVSLETYFVIVEMKALEKAFHHCLDLIKFYKKEIFNIEFSKRIIIELSLYALQKNISESLENLLYFNQKRFRLKMKLRRHGFNKVVEQIINPYKIYKLVKLLDETKALIENNNYEDILKNVKIRKTEDDILEIFTIN